MRCADVIPATGPYLDGELDAALAKGIAEHVACCPECRAHYDHERDLDGRIARALRSSPTERGDARQWTTILQRALPGSLAIRTDRPWRRLAGGRMAWMAMAASLALLAALASAGIGLRHGGHLPVTSPPLPIRSE